MIITRALLVFTLSLSCQVFVAYGFSDGRQSPLQGQVRYLSPPVKLSAAKFQESFDPSHSDKAKLHSSVINLTKNAVGAGVFSLSAKLLAVSVRSDPKLLTKAVGLIFAFTTWAAYNFYTVTEVSRMTESSNYPECWSEAVSPGSRWVIQGMLTVAPLIGCLANTIVLTELFAGLLQAAHFSSAVYGSRNAVAFILCSCIIFPLCSLENLKSMQGTSILGLVGQLVAMAVVGVRVLDKSYLAGGKFAAAATSSGVGVGAAASIAAVAAKRPSLLRWFTFASLVSYCLMTHYNAPKYLAELENNTPRRTVQLIGVSFASAAAFYAVSMYLGLAAFGPAVKPYLINNLSAGDPLASVARLAIAASILASTPLMFMNVRNWLVSVARKRLPVLGHTQRMAGVLVIAMGALATRLTDIGKIGSLTGAVLGANVMFTLPPVMYIAALRKRAVQNGKPVNKVVVGVNTVLAACGAAFSVIATYHSMISFFR